MPALLGLARAIDRFSSWLGVVIGGITLLMIAVGLFNVFGRFADRYLGTQFSSNSLLELQWYLFSVIFLLGGAYVMSLDEHVRVDVLYGRLRPRQRALINLLGTLLFLLPFCVIALWVAIPWFQLSYGMQESSSDPGGLLRWPVKLLVPIGFVLLFIQGISEAIKAAGALSGHYEYRTQDELEALRAEVQLDRAGLDGLLVGLPDEAEAGTDAAAKTPDEQRKK
ncbi:C4-dicarboxylate ABC transporter substrate-binding protein [Deinococcus aerophilus]|uniref:C4-dicarboxylate ABC transporter substrate-binding protein n=1 Tax=Deinococcus aerophilus TaxID=522488 RepID=A0ABQ2GJ03_9DEIO|nr:C4-dicarboxylate ABC transporter substrate-binding protein [Deinococcus aerophilus]